MRGSTGHFAGVLCIIVTSAMLTPASARAPLAACEVRGANAVGPSRLDYLVFASLADSSSAWSIPLSRAEP